MKLAILGHIGRARLANRYEQTGQPKACRAEMGRLCQIPWPSTGRVWWAVDWPQACPAHLTPLLPRNDAEAKTHLTGPHSMYLVVSSNQRGTFLSSPSKQYLKNIPVLANKIPIDVNNKRLKVNKAEFSNLLLTIFLFSFET